MSIFENANRKVEKHNYGMNSKFNKFGSRIIDLPEKQEPVTEDITAKIIQGPDTVKPELSPGEKSYRETRVQNAINYNTKSNIMKNMHSEILNGVLENVIGSIYYDALYLDDDFKEYNSAAITESVHDFLTERGGYKYIQEAYDRTKSPLLKSIMDICEETASAVSQRKIKECNEKANNKQSLDDIKIFDMNNDEKEKLNYEKDTLGIDKISSVIKDKILNVVKDEKKREAEHVELIEEIENQLSEDETVNDEKAVAEALSSIFIQNSNLEEGTLFNSMLRKNYKNVIESGYNSLTLSKMDCQSELDELMNNVTLESILTEDEIVDPKGQLITTEVKDVFNDFMDRLERQKDLGNSDSDALLEAFACCENKFYEVANSKISKTELKAIRRDFKILQETFNEFLPVEEGKITGAISKGFDKVDTAIITSLYKAIVKMSKDPDVIRRQIDRDKNIIKVCKAELKDRENLDDSKLQKMWKNIKGSYYYAFCSASVNERLQAGDRKGTKKIDEKTMRKLIKYGEIFIRLGEKRIKELESGKKSVKESFDDIDYDLLYEAVEECGCILDDDLCDKDIDIIEESSGKDDKQDEKVYALYSKTIDNINDASEIEKLIKQNDEMYKKFKDEEEKRENANGLSKFLKTVKNSAILAIPGVGVLLQNNPQHSPNFILRRHIKNNRICDKLLKQRLAELKKGKKSVKESFDIEYDAWADDFDDDSIEIIDDFETVEEKNVITNNKFVDSVKDKFTPPGSKKKKEDEEKNNKKEEKDDKKAKPTKEGTDCDNAGGCGATKEGVECGETSSKKLKKIDTAFDMDEKVRVKENSYEFFDIDDEFDLTEEAMSATQTAKEATKNKTVKEACSDILDECMTIIDKKLDLHEASDLNMAREVCVRENSYNCPTIIPIMNKKDIQLEGLDLPYKMKHVLESLTNILTGLSNDDRTDIVAKALKTNKENVTAILESCKSIPSTPVYKINFFNTFNDLLDILTENVNDIAESNKLIDFREYDDEFLDMYEDDYTYKVITESFNDFSIEGGDEFIDMDFVLADTIAKYTLLETMYTLQLENPKYNDIKNMTNKILNR